VFYSAKDRLDTIHAASLITPKAVADADILEGPAQDKKAFQLHFNDKVICDFDAPGSKMGGKTPKFSCKITRVESTDGVIQTLTPEMDEEPVKVKFGADDNDPGGSRRHPPDVGAGFLRRLVVPGPCRVS
jgi:hypothetical protein